MTEKFTGWCIWPEGQTEKAVFVTTRRQKWWKLNGPMGWKAMLNGRRMTQTHVHETSLTPQEMAQASENLFEYMKKHGR